MTEFFEDRNDTHGSLPYFVPCHIHTISRILGSSHQTEITETPSAASSASFYCIQKERAVFSESESEQ